jgi:hypothetical protein
MKQSGSMCQLELGKVASMRIKALDLLDSSQPNQDDEIDENQRAFRTGACRADHVAPFPTVLSHQLHTPFLEKVI